MTKNTSNQRVQRYKLASFMTLNSSVLDTNGIGTFQYTIYMIANVSEHTVTATDTH